MLNTSLLTAATTVMNSTSPAMFTITARFLNGSSGSTFSLYPYKINQLVYNRDYKENFADEIDMEFKISPKDFALMQDQGQNLLCILTLTYMDKYGTVLTTPSPVQVQYNVMIANPRDIRSAIPDIQMYTTPSETMIVRLIEKTVYQARQTKLNTIFQSATVTQAIYSLAHDLGITNIHMVKSDNTHTFDHIDIGSHQGIASIFTFIQSKAGVYQKGTNAYITGGVLYIYPSFETAPTYDKNITFYQVDTGRFAGKDVYHNTSGSSTSVVVNSQVHSYDLSVSGSENVGTGFLFTRASRLTDGLVTIDSAKGAQFTNSPSMTVNLATARTAIQGSNNMYHIPSTDNPFPHMARIISQQASLMHFGWKSADPFLIDPPHQVTYYYDQNGSMVKKTGMVESAKYTLSFYQKLHDQDIFVCMGELTLRLSPNATTVV